MNISTSDTTYNTVLDNIVKVVKSQLSSILGWNAELHAEDYIFAANGGIVYNFQFPYVNSLNSLSYKADVLDSDFTSISSADYRLLLLNNVYKIYYSSSFTVDTLYKANITIGYDTNTIPYEIWQILREMASIIFKEGDFSDTNKARLGIASINENLLSVTSSTSFIDLRSRWKKDLQKYRIAVV